MPHLLQQTWHQSQKTDLASMNMTLHLCLSIPCCHHNDLLFRRGAGVATRAVAAIAYIAVLDHGVDRLDCIGVSTHAHASMH